MNYWVNRISHGFPISGVMLRYGYLSVGWSDSAVEILKTVDKGREAFKEQFYNIFPNDLRNWDSLWRFLKEYEIGDIVLVPFPDEHNNKFSIVKICSTAEVSTIADLADIGFVRAVEHLRCDLSRELLEETAGSKLFSPQLTTYNITKYEGVIQNLLGDC